MTTKQLEQIVHRKPFQPFRLRLANGEQVVVKQRRKSHVSGPQVALVGDTKKTNGVTVRGFRIITVDQIASAETIQPSSRE
jgi:hypothetical protein